MLNPKQIKTIQVVMVFFIVCTVMCVAYIIYSNNKRADENSDAEYYFQMSSALKKANDSLINTQKADTSNIYIIATDSLVKLQYFHTELPDSVNEQVGKGNYKKLRVVE